ncbi:MAG TPA: tetratricopeptide repeat protein [Kofleriaceae bacterium]|jgi:Meckel syndrome type 1 protein|nr:tetratricopeptide repeat protein [Kofleriaceae bacterium]
MSSESTDVVEIDAIGVDEWEHEQHTPRAMDENLAALVKQSGAQSGPVRAPTVDDAWEADGQAEPAKQRTTTNTVARPAPPKPKTKTMALPTVAAVPPKPTASKPSAVPRAIAPVVTKAIVAPAKTHPGDEPPPGFVEVKPLAARGAPRVAKAPPSPAVNPKPAKPAAKATLPSIVAVAAKPAPKLAAKPTPARAATPPQPIAVVTAEPKPTPLPFAPMTLPAWPPTNTFEDWDNPQSGATSVGNRVSPSRPVSSDFKPEDSVIVDLHAKPSADKPRRPQTYPVIQTSEQHPSASGVFVMPTAAQPNATPVPPERVSAPELPPPPVALVGGDRGSSPSWTTPLPQRLPGEPIAAPAASGWPSAAGLGYEPSAPLVAEPAAPLAAKRTVVAALLPLARSRGVVIAVAGATVLALVFAIGARGTHDSKQPAIVATSAPSAKPADATATHVMPARAGAMPAPKQIAAAEPVVSPTLPAKPRVAMRRIVRSKKPVVVDYDKKPSSSPDADEALAQARAAYAIGNQHLFAGEGREAVAAYRNALSIYPSYAAGYRGLGLAFAQQGDKPSAIAAFKTYVKLAPAAKDVELIQKRIRNLSVH